MYNLKLFVAKEISKGSNFEKDKYKVLYQHVLLYNDLNNIKICYIEIHIFIIWGYALKKDSEIQTFCMICL